MGDILINMGIKNDALELLAKLYNFKIEGKKLNLDDIFVSLKISTNRFMNAYEYLKEKDLIGEKGRTISGRTKNGLPNLIGLHITSTGIDALEEEDVFKDNFGSLKIEINQKGQVNIVNQNQGQSVNNISAPIVKDVSHNNTETVNYGNIIHNQTITDNSTTYDIDKKDVAFIEKASITIINKYGEKKPTIVGTISLVSGLITIFGGFDSILERDIFFSWIPNWVPSISNEYGVAVLWIGFILAIFGGFLISLVHYKYESRCPKCKRFYSVTEVGDPEVREVNVRGGVQRTTYRTYECKHEDCDYKETKKFNEFIPDSELSNE